MWAEERGKSTKLNIKKMATTHTFAVLRKSRRAEPHEHDNETQQWVNNYRIIVFCWTLFGMLIGRGELNSILPFIYNEIVVWLLCVLCCCSMKIVCSSIDRIGWSGEKNSIHFQHKTEKFSLYERCASTTMGRAQNWISINFLFLLCCFFLSAIGIHQRILLWIVLMFFVRAPVDILSLWIISEINFPPPSRALSCRFQLSHRENAQLKIASVRTIFFKQLEVIELFTREREWKCMENFPHSLERAPTPPPQK